jgi:hypothetical protein
MKKVFVAILAAGSFAAAAVTAPPPAQARNEGAIAAGVVGGLAVGAIIGSAASRPVYAYPAYRPAPGYVVYETYGAPYPVSCPSGYWARKPVAFDRAGRAVAWSKPRFICPAY